MTTLYSMTGFGRGHAESEDAAIAVQVRSVNHRGLDLRCHLPAVLAHLEPELIARARASLGRGRVEIRVEIDTRRAATARLDLDAACAMYEDAEALRERIGAAQPATLDALLRLAGVWRESAPATDDAVLATLLWQGVDLAFEELNQSRAREGAALAADLLARIERLGDAYTAAALRAPLRVEAYRSRLSERIETFRRDTDIVLEPARLAAEVALMADKFDVEEELTRLRAHLDELARLASLDHGAGARVGKRLDFVLQEVGREVNTMAAKSRDTDLTAIALDMKTELESLREQAANIQ